MPAKSVHVPAALEVSDSPTSAMALVRWSLFWAAIQNRLMYGSYRVMTSTIGWPGRAMPEKKFFTVLLEMLAPDLSNTLMCWLVVTSRSLGPAAIDGSGGVDDPVEVSPWNRRLNPTPSGARPALVVCGSGETIVFVVSGASPASSSPSPSASTSASSSSTTVPSAASGAAHGLAETP